MELTEKNFCPNIKNMSTMMKISYVCKKTGRICPKVDYSSGKALPSKFFVKNGCPLMKEENEQIIEEVKEVVKEIPAEEPVSENVLEESAKPVVATIEKVEEKPIQQSKPKTNNYKKKKTNNKK